MKLEEALTVIFENEGGFANDKDDHGGATNYGITQGVYHDWLEDHGRALEPVRNITKTTAAEIYRTNYWLDGQCDKLPEHLALVHFDMCVNAGVRQAALILQRALKVKDDGVIGPKTLAAAAAMNPIVAVERYTKYRVSFYFGLTSDPTQRKFWNSWLTRSLHTMSLTYARIWKSQNIQ